MNKFISFLLWCVFLPCSMLAQTTQDFASRFMKDNAGNTELTCVTVGPKMLDEMLKIKNDKQDAKDFQSIMSGVKSIRIITADSSETNYRNKAIALLEKYSKRYSPYNRKNSEINYGDCIWIRKRSNQIVELVYVVPDNGNEFMILNVTGRISDDFIDEMIKI